MPNRKNFGKEIEQRFNLRVLVNLKKTPEESYNLLREVYGMDTVPRYTVYLWHEKMLAGKTVEDEDMSSYYLEPTSSQTMGNSQKKSDSV